MLRNRDAARIELIADLAEHLLRVIERAALRRAGCAMGVDARGQRIGHFVVEVADRDKFRIGKRLIDVCVVAAEVAAADHGHAQHFCIFHHYFPLFLRLAVISRPSGNR